MVMRPNHMQLSTNLRALLTTKPFFIVRGTLQNKPTYVRAEQKSASVVFLLLYPSCLVTSCELVDPLATTVAKINFVPY
jgi:hypothetical protein